MADTAAMTAMRQICQRKKYYKMAATAAMTTMTTMTAMIVMTAMTRYTNTIDIEKTTLLKIGDNKTTRQDGKTWVHEFPSMHAQLKIVF